MFDKNCIGKEKLVLSGYGIVFDHNDSLYELRFIQLLLLLIKMNFCTIIKIEMI